MFRITGTMTTQYRKEGDSMRISIDADYIRDIQAALEAMYDSLAAEIEKEGRT